MNKLLAAVFVLVGFSACAFDVAPDNLSDDPIDATDIAGQAHALSACNPDTQFKSFLDSKFPASSYQHWGNVWSHTYESYDTHATYWFYVDLRTATRVEFHEGWWFNSNHAPQPVGQEGNCLCGRNPFCQTPGMLFP